MMVTPCSVMRTARKAANDLLALLIVALFLSTASAQADANGHAEVQLIAETTSIAPGRPFWVGMQFQIEQGWHLYWRNPGDAGLGPDVAWHLPDGWTAGEIQWPYPKRVDAPPITSYAYTGEATLLVEITPPKDLKPGDRPTLRADVFWLACKEACVAGNAEVQLSFPVSTAEPVADERWAERFKQTRQRLPVKPDGWTVRAVLDDGQITFDLTPPDTFAGPLAGVQFFPYKDDLIDHAAAQELSTADGSYTLRVRRSRQRSDPPDRVAGVLVSSSGWGADATAKAIEIDVIAQEADQGRVSGDDKQSTRESKEAQG